MPKQLLLKAELKIPILKGSSRKLNFGKPYYTYCVEGTVQEFTPPLNRDSQSHITYHHCFYPHSLPERAFQIPIHSWLPFRSFQLVPGYTYVTQGILYKRLIVFDNLISVFVGHKVKVNNVASERNHYAVVKSSVILKFADTIYTVFTLLLLYVSVSSNGGSNIFVDANPAQYIILEINTDSKKELDIKSNISAPLISNDRDIEAITNPVKAIKQKTDDLQRN
ncbi:Protein of unknown function [Cotesia congregata]|uniref:Uncharacterized protein n=1 Tax=Cotesia congregata TaxID=51543 RepID=A0A8J2HAC6_COTCN|nr:Protein of unknown function [Cotesia congregata]